MHKKVKRICIFGAGSAGWVTVLGLKALLPGVDITIICPNKHGSIGVGESTLPDLLWLLEQAGIDLPHFMANTDSVFKHGMYFKNWNGEGTQYWHPFSSLERTGNMYSRAHHYHNMKLGSLYEYIIFLVYSMSLMKGQQLHQPHQTCYFHYIPSHLSRSKRNCIAKYFE